MKDFKNIIHPIAEEVKEIAHKLQEDEKLSLTDAEQSLRETTRGWERT